MDDKREDKAPGGRLLGLDIGGRRIGAAISDELQITVRPLAPIAAGSWKHLLSEVTRLVAEFETQALVIGWPLRLDGSEGDAALEMRHLADKFRRSLAIPVFLQDERLTTMAAAERLRDAGVNRKDNATRIDSEAAAFILQDFITHRSS